MDFFDEAAVDVTIRPLAGSTDTYQVDHTSGQVFVTDPVRELTFGDILFT